MKGYAWLSYLLEVSITTCWFMSFDLHVQDLGIRCSFAAEDAESNQIILFSFGFDVDATFGAVVLHIAINVVVDGIAMHVAPEPDVEHTTVDSDGVCFHDAKITKENNTCFFRFFSLTLCRFKMVDMLTEEDKFSFEEKPMSTTPEPSIFEAVSQEKVKTEIVTIGRSRTNDIVIDDDLVSRYHCRIEMMGDYCCIFNLSLYGDTFLNEVRIRDKAFLRRGDIIRIGNTLIGINIGEDDDPITKSDLVCSSYNWGPPLNIYPKGMFYDGVELTDRYKAVIDEVEKNWKEDSDLILVMAV